MANQKRSRNRCSGFYLPQELVKEVLFRLPVKSLVRFKCVCKDWFTFINDPQFAKAQLQQVKPPVGLIVELSKRGILSYFNLEVEKEGGGGEIDFNVKELVRDTVIPEDSCNGLLLLKTKTEGPVRQFYICNPITQWHLKLPQFLLGNHVIHLSSTLAYDNSKQKYKVVITLANFGSRVGILYKCGVFTLGDKEGGDAGDGSSCGSWRELDMPAAYRLSHCQPLRLSHCQPLSANGSLHWKGHRRSDLDEYILLMDLATEEFREIRAPLQRTQWRFSVLLEMNGSLGLLYPSLDQVFDLWVLCDPVKQVWNKQFPINNNNNNNQALFPTYFGKPLLGNDWCHPVVVMEKSSPVIVFLKRLIRADKELVIYNLDNRQFKVVHKGTGMKNLRKVIVHVNSLISC